MQGIDVVLHKNKQFTVQNVEDYKVIGSENNSTTITVHFPEEYENYSKRVDFKNIKGEKWTIALYIPEEETKQYDENFDKNNFSFTLPRQVTIKGELKIQFIAYLTDESESFVPFELLKIDVKDDIMYVKKTASDNPDLIVKAYENSNKALELSREAFGTIDKAEKAAEVSKNSAVSALESATSAKERAEESKISAENSELYAKNAKENSDNAVNMSNQAINVSNEALNVANNANAGSNTAIATANSANAKSETALEASTTAKTNSEEALTNSNTALENSEQAITTANEAKKISGEALEQVVDKMGTKVFLGSNEKPESNLSFSSNPQDQIDEIKNNTTAIKNDSGGFSCGENSVKEKGFNFRGFTLCDENGKIPVARLFDAIYPVGSIYISTNETNPGILFGGNWEAYAQGRTIVGNGTSDKDFIAGSTGGESTHTLTSEEMPSHTHIQNQHTHGADQKNFNFWFSQFTHKDNQPETDFIGCFKNADNTNVQLKQLDYNNNTDAIGSGNRWGYRKVSVTWNHKPVIQNATGTNQNTGGGEAHNNLQPYIVTYIWRRVS